ncbi:hypothetical protein D3C81_2184810 [compost metagenome]
MARRLQVETLPDADPAAYTGMSGLLSSQHHAGGNHILTLGEVVYRFELLIVVVRPLQVTLGLEHDQRLCVETPMRQYRGTR